MIPRRFAGCAAAAAAVTALVPRAAWCLFATALNASIAVRNARRQ